MMHIVYKPSTKAIRKGVMVPEDRIVLMPKIIKTIWPHYGLALLYQNATFKIEDEEFSGAVFKGVTPYKQKDSHLRLAHEDLPIELFLSFRDADEIALYEIDIPIKTLKIIAAWEDE